MNSLNEESLRRALEAVRPDPDEFRDEVLRKLAQREASEPQARSLSSPWRSAAAVLPLELLRPVGVSAPLSLVGKKLGAKGLTSAFVFPALSIAMAAFAFVATLRSLMRLRGTKHTSAEVADNAIRAWWKDHQWHAALTIVLLAAVAWTQPVEALVLILLVSMVVIAATLGQLSRAGAASRATVGTFTSTFLGALLGLALMFDEFGAGLRSRHVPDYWAPLLVLSGSLICDLLGRWRSDWSLFKRIGSASGLALGLAACGLYLNERVHPVSDAQLQRYVAQFDEPPSDAVNWQRVGLVGEWLIDQNAAVNRDRIRAWIDQRWSEAQARGADYDTLLPESVLRGAVRLDVFPRGLWDALREPERFGYLLEHDGPLSYPAASRVDLGLRALARLDLSQDERDHLGRRLELGWPHEPVLQRLETMAALCTLAAALERPLPVRDLRDSVHAALLEHWRGERADEPREAGFATELADVEREIADIHLVNATLAAVELIERFGLPPGIELKRLEAFLQRVATPSLIEALSPRGFEAISVQPYRYVAAVALRKLHATTEWSEHDREPNLLAALISERVLVASLLLVVLCIFATLRVARREA